MGEGNKSKSSKSTPQLNNRQLKIRETLILLLDQCQKTFAAHKAAIKTAQRLYLLDKEFFKKEFLSHLNQVLVVFKREPAAERLVQFVVSLATSFSSQPINSQPMDLDSSQSSQSKLSQEEEATKKQKKQKKSKKGDESEEEEDEEPKRKKKKPSSPSKNKKNKKDQSSEEEQSDSESEEDKKDEFAIFLIKYLLQYCGARDKGVRFRCTQIIAGMLMNWEVIELGLWDDIEEQVSERIHDKFPSIRCQAVVALSKLQNPDAKKDIVIDDFLKLLQNDSSKDVRKTVLSHIAITKDTLQSIVDRARDVNPEVRKHAFTIIGEKVSIRKLNLSQRMLLLRDGLKDRDGSVRESCISMLSDKWLKESDDDPIRLIRYFDIEDEDNQDLVDLAIRSVLSKNKLETDINLDDLDRETVLYWRIYCQHLKSQKEDDALEGCLPPLIKFCDIVSDNLSDYFMVKQLLLLARLFDFADEVGRRKMSDMLRKLLPSPSLPIDVRRVVMRLLSRVHGNEDDFINIMLEIISDIQDPLDANDLNRYDKEEDKWLHCLSITEDILENTRKNLTNPGIAGLLHSVILPSIQDQNVTVRHSGFKCLGMFCLLDEEAAKSHLLIFIQAAKNDREIIKETAIKVMFDLLLTFGVSTFEESDDYEQVLSQEFSQYSQPTIAEIYEEEEEKPKKGVLIQTLLTFLNHPKSDIRTTTVEGFSKLLFTDVYYDTNILVRLFVSYFDPTTENDLRLRQSLSVFFPLYARIHPEKLEKSFLPTLQTFLRATKRSSISNVPINEVAQLILYLLTDRMDNNNNSTPMKSNVSNQYHDRLSIALVEEVLSNPIGGDTKQLCKVLPMLELSSRTPKETLHTLKYYCDTLIKNIESKDKSAAKSLEKFIGLINGHLDKLEHKGGVLSPEKFAELEEKVKKSFGLKDDDSDKGSLMSPVAGGGGDGFPTPLTQFAKSDKQYNPMVKQQLDYFRSIDTFEVQGMEPETTPPVKRKLNLVYDENEDDEENENNEWARERKRLLEKNEEMEKELMRLRQLLNNVPTHKIPSMVSSPVTPKKVASKPIDTKHTPGISSKEAKPYKLKSQRKESTTTTSTPMKSSQSHVVDDYDNGGDLIQDEDDKKSLKPAIRKKDSPKATTRSVKFQLLNGKLTPSPINESTPQIKKRSNDDDKQEQEEEEEQEQEINRNDNKKKQKIKQQEQIDKDKDDDQFSPTQKVKRPEVSATPEKHDTKKRKEQAIPTTNSQRDNKKQKLEQEKQSEPPKKTSPKKQVSPTRDGVIPEITTLVPQQTPSKFKQSSSQSYEKTNCKKVVVALSGFKPDENRQKTDLLDRVIVLGGSVKSSDEFNSKLSHIVTPQPYTRTMKTLAASITGKWIVTPQWLIDSTDAGYFVKEDSYGFKGTSSPFAGKKVFISAKFKFENRDKKFPDSNFVMLIEKLGCGQIIKYPSNADITLIATNDKDDSYEGTLLTWSGFFDFIQPQTKKDK